MASNDIAIVGMGCLAPGALNPEQLWENARSGATFMSDVPDRLWRFDSFWSADRKAATKSYTKVGSFIPEFEFPFLEHRLPPRAVEGMDRAQVVGLECARQALADAGIDPRADILDRAVTVVGVIGVDGYAHGAAYLRRLRFGEAVAKRLAAVGVPAATIDALLEQFGEKLREWGHYLDPVHGATGDIEATVSNRIAQVFGARGFNMTVDAACAGGLVAIEIGSQALMAGDADVALAGGVDLGTSPAIYNGFARVGGLSSRGVATPFDASADGLVIGEGGGIVVLKRLEDALAAGDRIHAVVRGIGSSSDGAGTAIYTPSQEGRARAMELALESTGTDPAEVQYLECHATSTVVGDANEYDAIGDVYGGRRAGRAPLKLGSMKYQIGHLKGAAGVVSVIKTVRAMETGTYPHMPLFRELTHSATYEGDDLEIPTELTPWEPNPDGKQVAAVTASGFGGINYHLILERADSYQTPGPRVVPPRDMAVVGISCRVPGAREADGFWDNVMAERDLFGPLDPVKYKWEHLVDTIQTSRVAALGNDKFDSPRYRIFPAAVSQIAPTQLLALELTDDLLEGTRLDRKAPKNVAACIGAMHNDHFGDIFEPMLADEYRAALRACAAAADVPGDSLDAAMDAAEAHVAECRPPVTEHTLPGWMGNCVSGRMSKAFNLHGPNFVVDTACSSGLAAMMTAMYQLMFTPVDMVVSGGLNRSIAPELAYGESCIGALAIDTARPFDANSDGFLQGEGGVFYLLKRLDQAQRDGDDIVAVIRGAAGSSEADSRSLIAPSERAVRRAVRRALEQTDVDPASIGVVDTHGSGNALADIVEAKSISAELRGEHRHAPPVDITAVKSHVGHLFGGAAPSGLLSVIKTLRCGTVPAIRNLETVRAEVAALESTVAPARHAHPLAEGATAGAVSSLGLGGANYFLIVEAPRVDAPRVPARTPMPDALGESDPTIMTNQPSAAPVGRREASVAGGVFVATAADPTRLAAALEVALAADPIPESVGDAGDRARLAMSFESAEGLRSKLKVVRDHLAKGLDPALLESRGVFVHDAGRDGGKLAFCFSGQGNQYVGMARCLYMGDDTFKGLVDQVDAMARESLGFSIVQALYADDAPGQEATLGRLEGSQATIFAVELGVARVLERMGVMPDVVIGHSFGEFAAMAFAEVWSLEDAFAAVVARVRATQAVGNARALGMMSLNASQEIRDGLLSMCGDDLVLCNTNAPGRYVVGGDRGAIDKAFAMAEAGGFDATILPIGAAFHSRFMEPGVAPLHQALTGLRYAPPRIPIRSTVDGAMIEAEGFSAAQVAARLASQLTAPLDFPGHVEALHAAGVRTFLEVGPKWSVTKMVQAILDDRDYRAVPTLHPKVGDDETFRRAQAVLVALGRLTPNSPGGRRRHGLQPDFHAYLLDQEPELLPLLEAAYARYARGQGRRRDSAVSAAPAARVPAPAAPQPVVAPVAAAPAPVAPAASPAPVAAATADGVDVWEGRLRARLVERTGYPAEMLEAELDLEADLGIDSVQRAEIWTLLLDAHGLPGDLQPQGARTIRQLATFLAEAGAGASATVPVAAPAPASVGAPAPAPIAASGPAPVAAGAGADVGAWENRLRDKLVDRTGYPAEMLEPDLDLEADLGIDSVQRAEIWALLLDEHKLPGDLQPQGARTIRQLATFLAEADAGGAQAAAPEPATPVTAPEPAPTPSVQAPAPAAVSASSEGASVWEGRLRDKLVERTGYPAEMLEPDLDLEADLGIDSVQRAEIWTLLLDEHGLGADLQPQGARTLRELAAFLAEGQRAAGSAAAPSQPEAVEPPAESTEPDQDRIDLFAVTTHPVAAATQPFTCHNVLLVGGAGADGMADALTDVDVAVTRVTVEDLVGAPEERLDQLVEDCDTIVYTAHAELAFADGSQLGTENLQRLSRELFNSFRALVPRLESAPRRILVPVAQDGAFGGLHTPTGRPFGSFPAGFVRSLQRELPNCHFRLIDGGGTAWPALLADQIRTLSPGVETGASNRAEGVCMAPAIPEPTATAPVGADDLVFVTGGARGIVFECALALAQQTGCRLLLTGRTEPASGSPVWLTTAPEALDQTIRDLEIGWVRDEGLAMREAKARGRRARAQWEIARNLRRATDAGIDATYEPCDVSNADALGACLGRAARRGPIRGVVHGAGIQRSLRLGDLDEEHVLATVDTKLAPLVAMADILDWDEVRFLTAFGSVAGLFGNAGQTHYALANDVMTSLVRHLGERHPQLQAQTIQWTAWRGAGMVTDAQAERFAAGGLQLLDIDRGTRLFLDALCKCPSETELAAFNLASELAQARPVLTGTRRSRLVAHRDQTRPPRVRFSLARDLFLSQHLVAGNPVVPGTFVAEMMAEICDGNVAELHDVNFRRPLWVREEGFEVDVVKDGDRISVLPSRRREVPAEALPNLEFAHCRVAGEGRATDWTPPSLCDDVLERLRRGASGEAPEFYRLLDERFRSVLDTGPIFRGVSTMAEEDGTLHGLIRLTDEAMDSFAVSGQFRFHPVVADMAVQVAAAHGVVKRGVLAIPNNIERLRMNGGHTGRDAVVTCVPRKIEDDGANLDVAIRTLDGHLLLAMKGLRLRTLPPEAV